MVVLMQISAWENASPRAKRVVMGGIALAVFIVFASIIAMMDRSSKKPRIAAKTESESTMMMPSRKNTDMESMAASLTAAQRRIQTMESEQKASYSGVQEQLKQLREYMTTATAQKDLPELRSQYALMSKKLDELTASLSAAKTESARPAEVPKNLPPLDKVVPRKAADTLIAPPPVIAPANPPAPQESIAEPTLRIIGGEESAPSTPRATPVSATVGGAAKPGTVAAAAPASAPAAAPPAKAERDKAESAYFPMGSIIQGVLLNGLDAPTSGAATKNPTPVLVRIKHEAILPSRARMDIRECFVLLSGFGSMSQERAILRAEGISCVRDDGGVVETNLAGYAVGEDGKVGLKGRVVTKQGSMLAKSLAAGFLSGLGKALTPTGVTGLNLNPSGIQQTQTLDLGTAFESGLLGGASNSLNQIAKFYLDIAKEMVPVVEVDAGRPVTIIVSKGGSLKFTKK
ncbi:MAG: hypothetical protein D4R84_07645 [Rhodocyclaceae bacterium]|nr:MAG: hypothetical protein D4R84_07645 [Rhodocyclaceae bacterium]